MKTYSLAEVAALALPKPPELKDPERWLRRHLNDGRIKGYKVGRVWRMRQEQLDWLLDRLSNDVQEPHAEPVATTGAVSILSGMSERARARIQRQSDRRLA